MWHVDEVYALEMVKNVKLIEWMTRSIKIDKIAGFKIGFKMTQPLSDLLVRESQKFDSDFDVDASWDCDYNSLLKVFWHSLHVHLHEIILGLNNYKKPVLKDGRSELNLYELSVVSTDLKAHCQGQAREASANIRVVEAEGKWVSWKVVLS